MRAEQASERINSIFSNGARLAGFYAFLINNPHISFWNGVQIYAQRPSVTICKSFDDWHDQDNRRIKRGEHGVAYYDENRPNRKVFVFDISQTYGSERYRGVQHKMREIQLRDCINRQNVFNGVPKLGESEVQAAVYRYCKEHVADGETDEYTAEYLACLTEGVTQCMATFTGNTGVNVAPLPFDDDTNFRLCTEVLDIAEGLREIIIEEEQAREEKKKEKERRKNAKQLFSLENDKDEKEYRQLSLWELASGISEIGVSERISDITDDGATFTPFDFDTEAGNKSSGTTVQTRESEQVIFELPDERTELSTDGADNRRSNLDGSSVSAVHNYRLTDENFIYSTGAKTRFRQNVEAIKLMHEIRAAGRLATDEEKRILSKYVGWGGLAYAFDPDKPEWAKEYNELKELLDDTEYRLARESVLSAHYTPKTVIDGIYSGLKRIGFARGKILEPAMGIGNFIGLLPETFNAKETYGVEIDEITGNIANLLYPETKVKIQGFEKTNFADNSFDGVITNVPFGSFKVHDSKYDRLGFFIHNYFFAKSLDKVRPGGIIAAITTKGTLDKKDTDVRQYIANRAKLLGAIRLPNNAFKTSAGTEVTADILFFQKRDKIVEKAKDSWINVDVDENGVPVNKYYIEHTEMLLGTMAQHKSMYGGDDETELIPDERELGQAIAEAVAHLPESVYDEKKAVPVGQDVAEAELPIDEEHKNLKNYCYTFIGNTLYQREQDTLIARDISKTNIERMRALIALREQVRKVLNVQLENCTDEILQNEQKTLNRDYDKFVKTYGIVNSKLNRSLFREDADYALLISIEKVDDKTGTAEKTDIFSKRTIKPYQKVTHCNNVIDALNVCKSERGVVDLRVIERLTDKTYNEVVEELGDKVYRNPAKCMLDESDPYIGWEDASEYLSGNVRKKLEQAEWAAEYDDSYKRNVEALRLVQPAPLQANDISIKIGANWVDKKYYHQFICELAGIDSYYHNTVEVDFNSISGEWKVARPAWMRQTVKANSVFGTNRMDAFMIFERCLNQQTPTITDEVEDAEGKKKRVTNKKETIAVRERQRKINDEFKRWIFDDPERREYLVDKYNEQFNTTVVPQFDGSYLEFPGMNPEITLKPYQKDAVARMLQGNNVLLHHSVGAGKTFEIAAACMKLKECNTAKKPIIVVPNHLVVQWANEFRTLYPNANVLMATKKDFEKTSRKRFVAKVATGDWDAVVIAMSSFEKIPISRQRQEDRLNQEIAEIEIGIRQAKEEKGERIRIKDLERTLKNKRAMLEKLTSADKKDDLLQFEDLGVDYIFVDEAHKYKNKFIFTKMNNVSGISKAMSQRSSDMDLKCEYIGEVRGGDRGVVFATGTPISNSLVEMYTMQTYLQRNGLREVGLQFFDSWAALYTETVTALELAPSGQGYRTKTRVAKFTNLPELLKMYRSFADVKTADMLNLPVPEVNKIVEKLEPTETILKLNEDIVKRSERIADGAVEPWEDNMLCVTHDGKMIALDPRCFDATIPDDSNSKINRCVNNIFKIWSETMEHRSTQVVFCDMSTPKKMYSDYNPEQDFDVYNDIKRKLIECGIPEEEIAYIHEAKTDQQKQDIFDRVRNGDVRVFIGSTEKCGAGTNFQNKLIALHHLDTPFRPSDLEQREGRIVRQGNTNKEISLYTYVTQKTFDAYSYQILETKQRFISQINRGDLSVRVAEDIDDATLSFAEIKAITSGNPKIKRKMEIEVRLGQLSDLEKVYRDNRYAMQSQILHAPQQISEKEERIKNLQSDIALRDAHDKDLVRIGKNSFEERKDAGALLVKVVKSGEYVDKTVGYINGFKIVPQSKKGNSFYVKLVGAGSYDVTISDSDVGTMTRLENCLIDFEARLIHAQTDKESIERELAVAKEQVDMPFEQAEEVTRLRDELAEIDTELDLGKKDEMIVMDEDISEKPVIEVIEDDEENEAEVA